MIANGLQYNTLARWTLMQSPKESWDTIQAALVKGNTSVKSLSLGSQFYSNLSAEELQSFLLLCAQHLANLRVVTIGTLEFTKTPIQGASALGANTFLQTAKHLQTLRIERNVLLSSLQDVEALAIGFSHHASLRRISLPCLHPLETCSTLDPLIYALATLENLESLQLGLSESCIVWHEQGTGGHGTNRDGVSSPVAIGALGSLPHLSWLVLSRFLLHDGHIETLCGRIKEASYETSLTRTPSNKTIFSPIKILDLTKNRQLTTQAWRAVLDLLDDPTVGVHLEALDMYCGSRESLALKQDVNLYLKLNREGRRRMLRNMVGNRDEWIKMVTKYGFSNNLTALTILLRESPWMCLCRS